VGGRRARSEKLSRPIQSVAWFSIRIGMTGPASREPPRPRRRLA
jgi:hypothetical protein